MLKSFWLVNLVALGINLFAHSLFSQVDQGDNEKRLVTVKGRVVQNDDAKFAIDFDDFPIFFRQQVQLPQTPFPKNWNELKLEQRQSWIKKFDESTEGKKLIEARKKLIDGAAKFELNVEENGNYIIFDVPPGIYGLRGRTEQSIEGVNYVLEVFAQVKVSKDVEEVLLDPIQVLATRLLKAGESTPEFLVQTFDQKAEIGNRLVAGKNVLVYFWSIDSPPSLEFSKAVQAAYSALKDGKDLQLLSICVASDRDQSLSYVKSNKIRGWHGYADSWEHAVVNSFGVRVIPALFLLGSDGKVKLTNFDFRRASQVPDAKLEDIIVAAIAGNQTPTPTENRP